VSIRRNEIGGKISTANVKTVMKDGYGDIGLFIEEDRQQRAGLILRDVRYRLHASIKLTPKAQADDTLIKFERMFTRRAEKGQCINQPYLGCREFACDFFLCNCSTTRGYLDPIPENRDLGWMLYDMDYSNPVDPKPRFFKAALKSGIVWIPDRNSYGVRG
jgi:CRISPR-associated protein Cas5d